MTRIHATRLRTSEAQARSNIRWGILSFVIEASLVFIYTIILARLLGAGAFGTFAACAGAALICFVMLDLGTSLLVIRRVAQGELSLQGFRALRRVRIVGAVLIVAAVSVLWRYWPSAQGWGFILLLLVAAEGLGSGTSLGVAFLRGTNRLKQVAVVIGVERIATVAVLLILVPRVPLPDRTGVAAVAFLIARCFGLMVCVWLSKAAVRALPAYGEETARTLYRASAAMGSFVLVERGAVSILPTVMALTSSTVNAGVFQACFKIALAPVALTSALSGSLYPVFSGMKQGSISSGGDLFRKAARLTILVSASAAAFVLSAPSDILRTLYGAEYARAGVVALIGLTPYILMAGAWQLGLYALCAAGREGTALKTTILSALSSLCIAGGLAWAGPYSGSLGMTIGAIVGYAIYWPSLELLFGPMNSFRLWSPGIVAGALVFAINRTLLKGLDLQGLFALFACGGVAGAAVLSTSGILGQLWRRVANEA